jgi:phage tail-like protein
VAVNLAFQADAQVGVGVQADDHSAPPPVLGPQPPAKKPRPITEETVSNCRFYVFIDDKEQAIFTEVSGLEVQMDVTEYEEGGRNDFVHRLPGRTKIGTLTLKRGMTFSNDFFNWQMQIAQGSIQRRNVSVAMYDVSGKEIARWNFDKAFPIKWSGPPLQADGTAVAIETLELAHDGLKLGQTGGAT